jgi:hypothetical protein
VWKGLVEWGRGLGIGWLIDRKLPSVVSGLGLGPAQAKTDVQNIRHTDGLLASLQVKASAGAAVVRVERFAAQKVPGNRPFDRW